MIRFLEIDITISGVRKGAYKRGISRCNGDRVNIKRKLKPKKSSTCDTWCKNCELNQKTHIRHQNEILGIKQREQEIINKQGIRISKS